MCSIISRSVDRLFLVCILLLILSENFAQTLPVLDWVNVNTAGNSGATEFDKGKVHGVALDASGNVYVASKFFGTVDFDPGAGVVNLISAGDQDIFVNKFDAAGNLLWARAMGGTLRDVAYAITVDPNGNVYITGLFNGTADFDPGAGTFNLISAGATDIFICKLTTNGDFVWAKSIGNNDNSEGFSITTDASGNVYTTGFFTQQTDFNPGAGVFNLDFPSATCSSCEQIFILKLDTNGNFVWAIRGGQFGDSAGKSIALDPSGNILTTGYFWSNAFGAPSTGTEDAFIAKHDTNGNLLWGKAFGDSDDSGFEQETGFAVTSDASGNAYITGRYHNTVDFDPGAGVFNMTAVNSFDVFILKLNSSGNFVWAKSIGGTSTGVIYDAGYGIATDNSGNVYSTGGFRGTVDFDPGAGIFNIDDQGLGDIFISKLDTNGNFIWAGSMNGCCGRDGGFAIAVNNTGNIYTAGYYSGGGTTNPADFDPNACTFDVTGSGGTFLQKLKIGTLPDPPTLTSFSPTSGPIGTTVTITGTNFSTTPANNVVEFFNNLTATVTASTATSITTTVPVGATTGKISVTTNCITVQSATDFVVTSSNFITQWNLATAGSGATQLSFGTATSGVVNYTWQEISPGSATGSGSWSGATLTIGGLPTGSTVRLQIVPANFQRIIINSGSNRNRLTQIEQWGSVAWTSMQNAFAGCANLQVTATDVPILSGVTTMSGMFRFCNTLNSPSNIGSWNTSKVTDMSSLFSQAYAFNQNISSWNTSAVTNMSNLFADAATFNQNIGTWSTTAVTNMAGMFAGALAFNQNIGAWNTAGVNNMNSMFFSAYAFNQNIGGWNTGAVTNMSSMFGNAYDFNQNISTWNTSAVTNMSRMFEDAFDFNQNIGAWNTSAVTNMSGMFIDAYAFNQNIGTWNTVAVTNMNRMFDFATAFNQNIGTWNTATVIDMSGMFADASVFNQNIGTWSLNPGVNLTGMLNNSGMNCDNYSATLLGWDANPSTPNGRSLGATGRQYGTNAVAARTSLTSTKGWTITGDVPSGSACVLVTPTISNFTPASGPIGATVTITGTNFSATPANNTVQFNGTAAVVTASTATSISVTVPTGATTGKITVTVAGNTVTSSSDFTVTTSGGEVTINTEPLDTSIGGMVTKNLVPLITTLNNNLDVNSITVIVQPPSGAVATVANGVLTVNYQNISFSGKEIVTIRACDTNGNCATQQFEIEVAGDIVVYNALSPNGNTANQKFAIANIEALPETKNNTVTIFDRWQNEVWRGINYDNLTVVFTGVSEGGNDLPTGIYFYKIEFTSGKKIQTGFISLKR